MSANAIETLREITVWVCDECGYWRQEKRTGVHATNNPADPNGRMLTHVLRKATYRRAETGQ